MAESPSNVELALSNHLVLEKVLEYLEPSDLKSSRLVCKFWNNIGATFLAKKVNLVLEGSRLDRFLQLIPTANFLSVEKFESFIIKISSLQSINESISGLWPSIHFNIRFLELHASTFYVINELERLLLQKLPCIVSLKLVVTKFCGDYPVIYPSQNVSKSYTDEVQCNENLTTFQFIYLGSVSLYSFEADSGEDEFSFPIDWKLFFKRFPKLNVLGLNLRNFLNGVSTTEVSNMLNAMSAVGSASSRHGSHVASLEILDENIFPQVPNDEHLQILSTLDNSFQSLHLEVSPLVTIRYLNRLLNKCANTLKVLRLRRYPHPYSDFPITFTENKFNLITFLEVSESLLPSLSFLPNMPALERLHIILRDYRHLTCCETVENTENISSIVHPGVKFLYIEPPLLSQSCIEKLSVCLPGLETLRIRVNNEMLSEICRITKQRNSASWKNLTSLHITSWSGLTDEGITGINDQVLKFLGELSTEDVQRHRNNPYIGDIQGLESLTIEMWTDYDNHISDWSILHGVMELDNLENVTFVRCGITSSAFESIPVQKKSIIH